MSSEQISTSPPKTTSSRRRRGNPFRVYPVATLQTVDDVYSWTVNTPGVEMLSAEIVRFRKNFSSRTEDIGQLSPLVLGIGGPPGSGKTHLLLFARAKLERELPTGLMLMLRADVMPWDAWYTKVCGAALREANLPSLFTELLAREAITVAQALPATADTPMFWPLGQRVFSSTSARATSAPRTWRCAFAIQLIPCAQKHPQICARC